MDINQIIVWILMGCMVLGALDRAIGNKFGLGEQFEEGFNAMGPLALAMVGVISLAPVLAKLLNPVITPLYSLVGADPAMFAGTLLACDMGGWPLAEQLAQTEQAAKLSGLVLGSMMGATVVFTIPVALGIIDKEDRGYLAKGILAGICTIPIGVLVSGIAAGFPIAMVLVNLIPIVVAALLIAFGLWKFPNAMTKGFEWFGKILVAIISIGLMIAVFEHMTEVKIMPEGWELAPVTEGIEVVGVIAMMLLGAFPAVYLIIKLASKPLARVGALLGMNDTAAGGMIATLANNIPMFQIMKNMDPRGKVLNAAFAVSAAFALGDHLGFVAASSRDMIAPVIIGKLVAGFAAIGLALLLFGRSLPKASDEAKGAEVEAEAEGA
ncbi:MAG: ethanolamine utilization protein EutH [Propionibacteriaceae bacterium]|nr:ethanolamine utilization protein EutH [Propionibacteriaceae bacterium]